MQILKSISRVEWRGWALITIFLVLASSLPFIFGSVTTPPDLHFLGLNPLSLGDINAYYSLIEQSQQGHLFFSNLYTTESSGYISFQPLWLVLGWVSKLTHLSSIWIFQIARMFMTVLFLLVLYLLIAQFFKSTVRRLVCFLVAGFSSGLGVFAALGLKYEFIGQELYAWPSDLWISESNTFLSLYHSPLFILSQLLIVSIFLLFIRNLENKGRGTTLFIALLTLFLGITHPYDLIIVYSVLGVYAALQFLRKAFDRWSLVINYFLIVAISLPSLIYHLLTFYLDPALGGWAQQNQTPSPVVYCYILGYGCLLGLVVFALPYVWRRKNRYYLLAVTWVVITIILAYFPKMPFQRKLTNGVHVAIAVLATRGFFELDTFMRQRLSTRPFLKMLLPTALIWILVICLFATNLYVVYFSVSEYSTLGPTYYTSQENYQAMLWLKDQTTDNDAILSDQYNGNILPAVTARRVFLGHGHQTIDWWHKLDLVRYWFFANNWDDQKKYAFLKQNGIDYIYFGDEEKSDGRYQPSQKDYLERVFSNDRVDIYRVL